MKPKFSNLLLITSIVTSLSSMTRAATATYTWTTGDTTGLWSSTSTTTDWKSATYPNLAGSNVKISASAGNDAVTLDVDATVGQIVNSANGSGSRWNVLYNGTAYRTLTLDGTGFGANVFGSTNIAAIVDTASTNTSVLNANISMFNTDLDMGATFSTSGTSNLTIGTLGATTINNAGSTGDSTVSHNLNFRGTEKNSTTGLTINSDIGTSGANLTVNDFCNTGKAQLNGNLGSKVTAFTVNSNGIMIVAGANASYTGTTKIQFGTLQANATTNLGSVVMGASGTAGTLNTNGNSVTVTGLTTDVGATAASQTVNGTGTLIYAGGTSGFDGVIAGAGLRLNVNSGVLTLNGAGNSQTGLNTINGGTLNINSEWALGGAVYGGLTFGASGGTLQYNSTLLSGATYDLTANSLGVAKPVTLTGNATIDTNGNNITFANTLGASGAGSFTKAGGGVLTLNGTATHTGNTSVDGGTLKLGVASANSISASPRITVASGAILDVTGLNAGTIALTGSQTLAGVGSVTGAVSTTTGTHIAPGATPSSPAGANLTVDALTLGSGAQLDFDVTNTSTVDKITVTGTDALTINGGQLNLNGGAGYFSANGVYNLIGYSGVIGGTGVSALSVNTANQDLINHSYTIGESGGYVTLTIGNTGAVVNFWNANANGNWSTGPWTPAVPNAVGSFASFGGGGTAITAPRTVTVDGSHTVGTLSLNNATQAFTLASGSGANIILNNGASGAFVTDSAGSHLIQAPLTTTSNGATFSVVTLGDILTVSGVISGDGELTKTGNGLLALNAVNTYTADTHINGGTLAINSDDSLGDATYWTTIGSGTLEVTADITTLRNFDVTDATSTILVDANKTYSMLGAIGSGVGSLNKAGAGTLVLAGSNSYNGGTVVAGGVLAVGANSALGATPGAAIPGNLTIGTGTLSATNGFTINANRGISLTSASSTIDVAPASTLFYGGIAAGSGRLNLVGTGILDLSGANTYIGGTVINSGATLNLSGVGVPGTGQVTLAGGAVTLNRNLYTLPNVFVDAGQTGTIEGLNDRVSVSGLTGSGTLTLVSRYGGTNVGSGAFGFRLQGANGAFTGTINLQSGTGAISSFAAYFNGGSFDGNLSGATVNMTNFARIGGVNNSGGNTLTIGALSGDNTTILSGADYAGTNTYNIGGKNLNTTFAGIVNNGSAGNANIIKSGTGSLTLSGTNTYGGTTTVNAGTLAVTNASALGADTVGTTIAGGDVASKVTVTGGLTVTESWTLAGRQGANANSPAIVSVSGSNTLSGLVSPATGGTNYNVGCDAGTLTMSGRFTPTGAVTGTRYLQLVGAGNTEWSGAIEDGTAVTSVNCLDAGTRTLSGANTYTGNTSVGADSTLVLASSGSLNFRPTTNGTSNKLTGAGTANLNGTLRLDLTSANLTDGNTWTLVDVTTPTYGLVGISSPGLSFVNSSGVWTATSGSNTWTFSQSTGELSLTVTGYAGWAATNAGGQSPSNDADGDGVSNGVEYFMNSSAGFTANPGIVNGTVTWPNGGNINSSAYGTQFVVQTSSNLVSWTPVLISDTAHLSNTSGSVAYTLPTGSSKFFVRLVVTPN